MCERVGMRGFDQMQNRIYIVAGVWGNENERQGHGERDRN